MIRSFVHALEDTLSAPGLLAAAGSVLCALVLLGGALGAVWWLTADLEATGVGWLDVVLVWTGRVAAVIVGWFVMAPLIAAIVGAVAETALAAIERRRWPGAPAPRDQSLVEGIWVGLRAAGRALVVNLCLLPLLLIPGLQPFMIAIVLTANGFLLGREMYEVVAHRRMTRAEARAARTGRGGGPFAIGVGTAALFLVPGVNLVAALIGLLWMMHHVNARVVGLGHPAR